MECKNEDKLRTGAQAMTLNSTGPRVFMLLQKDNIELSLA